MALIIQTSVKFRDLGSCIFASLRHITYKLILESLLMLRHSIFSTVLKKITVLARKWRKGRCVSLPTNKLFEGLYLALLEKFLQKELRVFLYFKPLLNLKTGSKPSAVLLLTYASLASLAWGAGGESVNSTKRLWFLLALGTRIFLI